MTLQELRARRGMTQAELAGRLSMQQAAVSKLETRSDLYVSMLRGFIEALGGKLEITAMFPNERIAVSGLDKSSVLESLQRLVNGPCRIHPMPPERTDDEFRVSQVDESGNVTLEKLSNRQSLEIPVRRVLEVLPAMSDAPPTIVLHGNITWSAHRQLWKFVLG
jgi:transcriptional regulator with XRE-family HTH domain